MLLSRLLVVVAASTVTPVAGCGGDADPTADLGLPQTVTVTRTVSEAPAAPREGRKRVRSFRACDSNIRARIATTTCEFAQNVFYEFWNAQQHGEDEITAYSPATDSDYDLDCDAGFRVTCTGGDGSEVRFQMAAVDAYDASQADAYCQSHDVRGLGVGDGCEEGALLDDGEPPPDDAGCHPSYEAACLDPNSYDYDCDGGEGDGPDYTGYVEVVGEDVYDLDRDGDEIACES